MIRVREALTDSALRQALRRKLPLEAVAPDSGNRAAARPSAVMKELPAAEAASLVGIITEQLLQSEVGLTAADFAEACQRIANVRPSEAALRSVTTRRYLEAVEATRQAFRESAVGPLAFNPQVGLEGCIIQGHPDALTDTQIFEVKTTTRLEASWTDFLMQLFSYAALHPAAATVHMVLPLQTMIWTYDVSRWAKRAAFTTVLRAYRVPVAMPHPVWGDALWEAYPIGSHIGKLKSLADTLRQSTIAMAGRPVQVMFTRSAKMSMEDADVAEVAALTQTRGPWGPVRVFVHAPYLLNLSLELRPDDPYVVRALREHLTYAAAFGGRGVVVHVGKACHRPLEEALTNQRTTLMAVLEPGAATPECPLLLETPAGQGSETLTSPDDFIEFVRSIDSDLLGVCVDTCHVFAAGHSPSAYVRQVMEMLPGRLKLIHFNDSRGASCSCVDRHAPLGYGCIPQEEMTEVARMAAAANVPMIIE